MPYIANHTQRFPMTPAGKLYRKGDAIPLTYEEAQELLRYRAVEFVKNDKPVDMPDPKADDKPPKAGK